MIRHLPDGDDCSPDTIEKTGRRVVPVKANLVITTISIDHCL